MAEEPEHPIQVKARGKTLVTNSKRILDNIPAAFKTEAVVRIEKQAVPTEVGIDAVFSTQQVGSSVTMDNTTQSQKVNEFLDQPMPVTLVDSVITEEGQLGIHTRTLDNGIQTLTPDPEQIEGDVENLGGDKSVKTTIVVPEVFNNALYSKERPDEIIPAKFRVQLPTVTTRLDSAGTAAMPTLLPGDVGRQSEQVREGVKRDTVVARDLASATTVHGSLTTSEYGGDVADVLENVVDDTEEADSGEDVISSEVDAYGDGKGTKKTIRRTALGWPELIEYEADARLRAVLEIRKKVVPAEDVTPPSFTGLLQTEYKALDKWRSIQIITTLPDDILTQTNLYNITKHRSFPYQVDRAEYVTAVKRTNFTTPGSGVVANEVSSFDIALDLSYSGGYSGIVEARLTETFTTNPFSVLPTIFQYELVGGTICLGYTMSGIAVSGANVRTFLIKESLHGVIDPDPPSILNFSSGATIAGTIVSSAITWHPSIGIPASTPTSLNVGDWIVDDVNLEPWRGGIYVKSVLEVKVPG